MERDFGVLGDFVGGGGQSYPKAGVETAPAAVTTMGVDQAFLNGCFSELSFQSILQPLPASTTSMNYYMQYDAGVSAGSRAHYQTPESSSHGFLEQIFPASETPLNTYPFTCQDLKMPKDEHFDSREFAFQLLKLNNSAGVPPEQLINFFSTASDASVAGVGKANDDVFTGSLKSTEPKQNALPPVALHSPLYQAGPLNDMLTVHHHQLTSESSSSSSLNFDQVYSVMNRYMPYYKSSSAARQRRQRIGEKTRRLQRLLPWDKKMDTGTMLEEAYKYVKFLQAQVSVLQAMPLQSTTPPPNTSNPIADVISGYYDKNNNPSNNDDVWGELGKLNRQQLLQLVVNSPVAQTSLYSRGCCVYSREQLGLLQKLAEKSFWEQMESVSAFRCQY